MLHLHFRMTRGLTLGVRALVMNGNGEVLLVRHRYTSGWHFPGGGVEPHETVEAALSRELVEETGLRLVGVPKLHGIFFNRSVSQHDHVLVYLCETVGDLSKGLQSPEIADVGFFDLRELPDTIDQGTRYRLDEVARRKKIGQVWDSMPKAS